MVKKWTIKNLKITRINLVTIWEKEVLIHLDVKIRNLDTLISVKYEKV